MKQWNNPGGYGKTDGMDSLRTDNITKITQHKTCFVGYTVGSATVYTYLLVLSGLHFYGSHYMNNAQTKFMEVTNSTNFRNLKYYSAMQV